MADESIGGVSVKISGDASGLQADFAAAQTAAQAAGQGVAAAFNASAGSIKAAQEAVKLATANMAEAAAAFGPAAAAGNQVAIQALAQYQGELAAAKAQLDGFAVAERTAAVSTEVHTAALSHQVTQLQAVSGLLRVSEGAGAFRAAEKFLTIIPGIASFAQAIFPVVGLIALGEAAYRAYEKFDPLVKATKALEENTKKTGAEFGQLEGRLNALNVERITLLYGKLAGMKAAELYPELLAKRDQEDFDDTGRKIEETTVKMNRLAVLGRLLSAAGVPGLGKVAGHFEEADSRIRDAERQTQAVQKLKTEENQAKAENDRLKLQKQTAEESAQLQLAVIANKISANSRQETSDKKQAELVIAAAHEEQLARIAAIEDPHARAIQLAQEEARVAKQKADTISAIEAESARRHIQLLNQKAAQEGIGKDALPAQAARTAVRGEISGVEAQAAEQRLELYGRAAAAEARIDVTRATQQREVNQQWDEQVRKGFETLDKEWKQALTRGENYAARQAEQMVRVSEIAAKGAGVTNAAGIEAQKLASERAYGIEVGHTRNERIAHMRELASFDDRERQAKVAGLQAELLIAQQAADEGDSKEKVARIQEQINALTLEGANKAYAEETKILQLKERESLRGQIKAEGQRIPSSLGGALASGVVSGHNIGQQIAQSLRGIGQQMLGTVFTKLISTMLTQIATTIGLTAATTTNAGVTSLHAGVMVSHMAVMLGHAVVMVANTIATIANTIVTIILSTIEAIKALFGFADGGSPPVGVPSIVGERGPELFIPSQSGVIVPNHQLKGYADGAGLSLLSGSTYSSSNDSSTGDLHFHAHGINNPDQFIDHVMRKLPERVKSRNPQFSPYAR